MISLSNVNIDWLRTIGYIGLSSLIMLAGFLIAEFSETKIAKKMLSALVRARGRLAKFVLKYYYREEV